jgi:hypothetical protein
MTANEKSLIKEKVDTYKTVSYATLMKKIVAENHAGDTFEVDKNGKSYQIDVHIEWEDVKSKSIRVVGFINTDKPWWRQFVSNGSYGFIMNADGSIKAP